MPKILLDYTGTSQVTVYDATTGKKSVYTGLTEIEECFTELFAALPDLSSLGAPVVQVEEGPFGMVYLVWECPSSGFTHATDTFMFEAETGKIDKQMVVVQTAPKMEAAAKVRYTHSWLLMLNECVVLPCNPVTIYSSDVMCLGAGISGPRCGRMGQSLRGLWSTGRGKDLA